MLPSVHLGLDLDNVEETTRDEIKAFRGEMLESRRGKFMHPQSAYSVLLEHRPDMLKLQLRQMHAAFEIPGEGPFPMLPCMVMLNWYTCHRYGEGIIHEIRAMQRYGATREQVTETLALAYMHSGPAGMRYLYHEGYDYLASYQDPDHEAQWPAGWGPDADALKSGMDFSTSELTEADRDALFGWYESTIGEVPRSVQLLARHNPTFLKAWRHKLEGTLRGALPKQALPYTLIHYNVNRGFAGGTREAVLLGRAWGMTRAQVVAAVSFATAYVGGMDAMYLVDDAIGDLLEDPSWEAARV
jgi:hypothetical protein